MFVVLAYHGRDRDGTGAPRSFAARLETPAARGHRIVHRDHYANPRAFAYQMAMVVSATDIIAASDKPALVLDSALQDAESLPSEVADLFASIERVDPLDPAAWREGLLGQAGDFANVVLVWADALGLGCEAVDRVALERAPGLFVLNGRRRAFRFDRRLARRLRLSRFLAHTRIVEKALALTVQPLSALLAALDARRSRHGR
ncbi:hypothetical protein [Afifella pfennigii]|uniref:hypothetical protein n=1 Tax=Afifella pfennigii TaxID=209897 RepID=UPI0012EBA71D|nr:hypothetical protein [Afifella pfennigii]